MSIRLNVVLSQSAGGPSQRRELESEIVARLIGAAGIDLSLIGPLESLGENSTDRLMLERLGGDLALLSWETPAAASARLAAAQIAGRRAPHPLDPEPDAGSLGPETGKESPASERRIYHHPLGEQSAATVQAAIESLLAARRVVTFQLVPSASTPAQTPAPSASPSARTLPPVSAGPVSPGPVSAASSTAAAKDPAGPPSPPRRSRSTAEPASRPGPLEPPAPADPWDALVDELNDSNI